MTLLYASRVFTCKMNLDGILHTVGMQWTTEELWFDSIEGERDFSLLSVSLALGPTRWV